MNAVNHRSGFIYFSGHGNKRIWQINNSNNSWVGRYAPLKMMFLNNKNKLPVCIVEGCHISDFIKKSTDARIGY
ncbi:MAG: C25 family cysteine peptidase [Thermoplasmatota archaeon]